MNSDREMYIRFISDGLHAGTKKKLLGDLFTERFEVTVRTFLKYFNIAKPVYDKQRRAIEAKKEKLQINNEVKLFKAAIADKTLHAKQLASNIDHLQNLINEGNTVTTAEGKEVHMPLTIDETVKVSAEIRSIMQQIGKWYGFEVKETQPTANIKTQININRLNESEQRQLEESISRILDSDSEGASQV